MIESSNSLGQPVDRYGEIHQLKHVPIESPAPGVNGSTICFEPYKQELKLLMHLVPVGRGQRELVIGDS